MSKQLYIDPSAVRAPGSIHFEDIPVNRYQKTVRDEAGNFTKEQLVNLYRDMLTLREFETMINLIKTTGEYEGIAYNHPGPAHLSMGQEAAAVGEAFHLDVDDYIFGSHRAHSDILAKGLSAIEKLSDERLLGIMRGFLGARRSPPSSASRTTRSRIWRSTSCSTGRWPRSSRARPDSTAASADRCTRSLRRLASIRTTPSSAAPARSPWARRCTSA